jgi:hypothetical protein
MKEGNEVIAKFMGLVVHKKYGLEVEMPPDNPSAQGYLISPKYHTSWDWLMPAWIKFLKLLNDENLMTRNFPYYGDWYSKITGAIIRGDINETHELLCKGIEWYNNQKP